MFVTIRCPCCNRTYPSSFWGKIAAVGRDCLGFLMRARRREDGRGRGFDLVREVVLRRDVDPGVLALVKGRLLGAVKLWVQRGWLTDHEVMSILGEVKAGELDGRRVVLADERPGFRPVRKQYGRVAVARQPKMPMNRFFEKVEV